MMAVLKGIIADGTFLEPLIIMDGDRIITIGLTMPRTYIQWALQYRASPQQPGHQNRLLRLGPHRVHSP